MLRKEDDAAANDAEVAPPGAPAEAEPAAGGDRPPG
jgi:hypothetical protein